MWAPETKWRWILKLRPMSDKWTKRLCTEAEWGRHESIFVERNKQSADVMPSHRLSSTPYWSVCGWARFSSSFNWYTRPMRIHVTSTYYGWAKCLRRICVPQITIPFWKAFLHNSFRSFRFSHFTVFSARVFSPSFFCVRDAADAVAVAIVSGV